MMKNRQSKQKPSINICFLLQSNCLCIFTSYYKWIKTDFEVTISLKFAKNRRRVNFNSMVCCSISNFKWNAATFSINDSCENERSQSRSGINPSVKKMGFWDWSQSPQYAVVGLIPQNTGTCPRTAFYLLWDQSQNLKFFPLGSELPYFGLG